MFFFYCKIKLNITDQDAFSSFSSKTKPRRDDNKHKYLVKKFLIPNIYLERAGVITNANLLRI